MIKKLPSKTVVIVGGSLTAGLVARQLTARNINVLVLERGGDHTLGAEAKLPTQRDEWRWDTRQGLVQDWSVQTYTLRYNSAETALPVRWMEAFLPGESLGGAANHWSGHTWRWSEYEPQIRSRVETPAIERRAAPSFGPLKQIDAGVLSIGYAEAGPADGSAVMLLHVWPYDIHTYVEVVPLLASAGYRVFVPYLRGYGTTRFLSHETLRNAQPSAIASNIVACTDALKIERAILGGCCHWERGPRASLRRHGLSDARLWCR